MDVLEEVITKKECRRCGHEWYPKQPGRPTICPVCKNPRWDEPKEEAKQ